MIVRCDNCNSAFAVNDAKVDNKKFAFNCPNCAAENVIDNRAQARVGAAGKGLAAAAGNERRMAAPASVPAPAMPAEEEAFADDFGDLPALDEPVEPAAARADAKSREREEIPLDDFDDLATDVDLDKTLDELEKETDLAEGTGLDDELVMHEEPLDLADAEDLDLSLDDEPAPAKSRGAGKKQQEEDLSVDDLDLDLTADESLADDLDLDLSLDEPARPAAKKEAAVIQDELGDDISFDDIPEIALEEDEPATPRDKAVVDESELDMPDLDLPELADEAPASGGTDFLPLEDEEPLREAATPAQQGAKAKKPLPKPAEEDEDESITIDLDTLDIELEGEEEAPSAGELPESEDLLALDDEAPVARKADDEESVTLDLDSLDIEVQEDGVISSGETPDDLDLAIADDSFPAKGEGAAASEEEDVTLDLDSLDIDLDESPEIKEGEVPEEDEKLTLEDAGLTLEELTAEEVASAADITDDGDEEDIKLTIDDIDPSLNLETFGDELIEEKGATRGASSKLISEEIDELPEIEFEDGLEPIVTPDRAAPALREREYRDTGLDHELEDADADLASSHRAMIDKVTRGAVSFSVDYSLKYSRLGGALRLFCIHVLSLVPHFVVLTIYTVLSLILGMLNHVVVSITGNTVEDFSQIMENTLRYMLSLYAYMIGVVEDRPVFAGRAQIDHPLQLVITYPLNYSRFLALLRLSGIGMLVAALPHLLLLLVLTMLVPFLCLAGVIAVIVTSRWPNTLFDLFGRYLRYLARVFAFMAGLVDGYPPFYFN